MTTLRTRVLVPDDRRVTVALPPEAPVGEADLAIEVTRVEEGGAEIDDAKDRKQAFLDMLDRIWAMPRTGVRPTREEVDAYVEDLRGDWD